MPRSPLTALAGALVVVAVGLVLWRVASPSAGPLEPAWDRVACARCHMLVSDPAFAAQLQLASGEVLFFDDPGCLLLERAERADAAGAAWFHDSAGSGWLAEADARFVAGAETPMAHGFAAVSAGSAPGAVDAGAALAALRAGEAGAP